MEKREDKELENPTDISLTEIGSIKLIGMVDNTADLIQQVFDNFYKKFKLSRPQFAALYRIYLAGEEGITLSILGDQMLVTRANITTLIDRMVARGYIKRIVNENDRRSIKAVITQDGKKILENVLPTNQSFTSGLLNFLTEKERVCFYEILSKIQRYLIDNYLND